MYQIIEIASLRKYVQQNKRDGRSIGVVPTMGAFHEGHLTLMRCAKAANDIVIVTLFVNPTQFNDPSDFEKYPRDTERDLRMADDAGVDVVFMPTLDIMYPEGFATTVRVRGLPDLLEGASRPGHFDGVATVVTKLLNSIAADRAYFGEKDWQQLQIVKRLVADLNIPTEIVSVPTVREPDGLAMSSRNVRLTPEQRHAATVLSRALAETRTLVQTGTSDVAMLEAHLQKTISDEPLAKLDYASIVNPATMEPVEDLAQGGLAVVAVWFGDVRLIDNILLSEAWSML